MTEVWPQMLPEARLLRLQVLAFVLAQVGQILVRCSCQRLRDGRIAALHAVRCRSLRSLLSLITGATFQ